MYDQTFISLKIKMIRQIKVESNMIYIYIYSRNNVLIRNHKGKKMF